MNQDRLVAGLLGLFAFVLLAAAASWFYTSTRATSGALHLQLQVDGSDTIKVQKNRLWIEHHSHRRPGQIGMFNDAGALPDNNAVYVNGEAWKPRWRGDVSEAFQNEDPLIPSERRAYRTRKVSGKGHVTITESPTKANLYTMSIGIDDASHPGTSFYDLTLEW